MRAPLCWFVPTVAPTESSPRAQRLREGFQEDGFSYLLFLRLVPVFPFWLVNLAAALFGMRLLPYVAATAVGIIDGFVYLGTGLQSLALGWITTRNWTFWPVVMAPIAIMITPINRLIQ